jgi:hypothetical protein
VADLVSFDSSWQNHIVLRKATRYLLVKIKKRAKYHQTTWRKDRLIFNCALGPPGFQTLCFQQRQQLCKGENLPFFSQNSFFSLIKIVILRAVAGKVYT